MKHYVLSLAVLGTLMGCQSDTQDLQEFVAQVKQNTQISIEPYPTFSKTPAFKYQVADKRSPFQRLSGISADVVQTVKANCLQPDFSRAKHPLEQYGTDALSIKGFFTRQQQTWALIQANDGTLHKAKAGDHLGLFFGRITSIKDGNVYIIEMLPDGTGCWQEKQATLTVSQAAGEQKNV
ncbi:pilus assembly protein PilP [Bowmanella yangjiangensis]|uniref:Pilus assembly protein PilP n=1 Tax=Bowmanella yangjiangensis TaxID=2811230 RepID=A0ABS3CR99_9ALTE|nr:pilus assembly protein PilP [Bowmanella yangjiangensis]MBN7819621.1 pilus assembly protein PilP [Bowmanella yangjiangensis]